MSTISHNLPSLANAVIAPTAERPQFTLERRAIHGSAWTLAGYVAAQVLKLASNLILTRMLFPEAFGLMALVNTIIQGLEMFSDVGIGPSIIQNRRGNDARFINTAWTIQIIRGAGLFLCTCVLAVPFARFYGQPELVGLIVAAGLTSLLAGFNATAIVTLNRNLHLGRRTLFDLAMQCCNIGSTIALAAVYQSVWALVAGNVIEAALRAATSHAVLPGIRNRLAWDSESRTELFQFGRWIFIGTVLSFALQCDRLILGKLMTTYELGLYGVALGVSQMMVKMIRTYSGRVLFPLYARLWESEPEQLKARIMRIRGWLLAVSLPPVCAMIVCGPQIVDLLFDSRYHGAGWMLQVLAAGAAASVIGLTISPGLLAVGDSFRHMLAMAWQIALLAVCIVIGGWWSARAGVGAGAGVIVGISVSRFLAYPVNAVFARRYGLFMPGLDAMAFALCGVCIAAAWMISR